MIIGNARNITKLNMTLKFRNNIRKYNLTVLLKFSIAILDDIQTDLKTSLSSIVITYLEYANNIFNIIHKNSKTINI